MIWLQAGALVGLLAIVVPVIAHLVAQRPSQRLRFPTLRFFDDIPHRLRSRQVIRDWPLLLVRVGIVAAAATALARPVFVNTWRVARAMQRDVRAVIVDTSGSMGRRAAASQGSLLDQARQRASVDVTTASASTVFEAVDVRAGMSMAVRWLATAPPGGQSISVYTDAQRGALPTAVLAEVPRHVGLELVVIDAAPGARTALPARLAMAGGSPRASARVVAEAAGGALVVEQGDEVGADACQTPVQVHVEGRQALADALRARVVEGGVPCAPPGSPAMRIYLGVPAGDSPTGASAPFTPAMLPLISRVLAELPPADRAGVTWTRDGDVLQARSAIDARDDVAFRLVAAAFAAYEDPASAPEADPRVESEATRASWRRTPSPPPADAFRHDPSSDGRLLWAAVLALLGVEAWLRRGRTRRAADVAGGTRAA